MVMHRTVIETSILEIRILFIIFGMFFNLLLNIYMAFILINALYMCFRNKIYDNLTVVLPESNFRIDTWN